MKKLLFFITIAAIFVACSSGPKSTAEKFLTNMGKGNIEEAKKYCTEPTKKLLDMASAFGGAPINPDLKLTHVKDSIVDNRAWVTFIDEKEKVDVVELVKLDGDWKVNITSKK